MNKQEIAVLGGGCFWCIEPTFKSLKGVESVESGYSGGKKENPTYSEICTGLTGHVEVIQIKFDPEIITFKTILEIFFKLHDPTTLNRQGNDVGTQYRSVIFYSNNAQKETSEAFIKDTQSTFSNLIVTEITELERFYKAEEYHQDYYFNNRTQPYCRIIIDPKFKKLQKEYQDIMKEIV